MEWITQEEVRAAAKKSPEAAIDCCIKHYTQLVTASAEELRDGFAGEEVSTQMTHCALCKRHIDYTAAIKCRNCLLVELGTENDGGGSCCQEWKIVSNASYEMRKADYSPKTVHTFQSACHDMLSLLFKCRRAEVAKAEPKKEELQGWERSVNRGIRISSTTADITSEDWPVRLSMISNHSQRWWEGRPMGEYGVRMGPIPGETFTVKDAREVASAINELCDIIEASETQEEGKK